MLCRSFAAFVVASTITGCSTFESRRSLGPNDTTIGLRIPDQKPLLVINNGTVSTIMVPNADRATALNFKAFLAKNDVTLKFNGGVLTEITSNQDSTAALATINEAIKNIDKIATAAAAFSGGQTGGLQVYDIVFDGQGNIVRLKPMLRREDLLVVEPSEAGRTSIDDLNDDAENASATCATGKKKQADGSCK